MINVEINEIWFSKLFDSISEILFLPRHEWNNLKEKLHFMKIMKDEYFIKAGEYPDKIAFIFKGLFRIFYMTDSGNEKVTVFRRENDVISAYTAFLENTHSYYSIQALEDSILFYISLKDYKLLLDEAPYWHNITTKYIQMLFIEKEKREEEFRCFDAMTRYQHFLQHYPDLEKRINQYQIAAYLGITPVALSRLRKKMKKLT